MKIHHLLLLLLFFSCQKESLENGDISLMDFEVENIMVAPASSQPPPPDSEIENIEIAKKIIKTGGIDFQSNDIVKDYKKIQSLLPQFQAYIENENQSKSAQRINYNLTIRVPSKVYDTLYSSLTSLAYRLDNRYSNVEDVTERYYDLKTRIKNKKVLEQRYIKLLDKASSIKDILEIERNINEIRTDIERFQGQLNYLSKRVRLSTINLSFYEVLPYTYDSLERKGFGARVLSALDNGWQGLLSVLIGLSSLWPFIILTLLGIILFRKLRKKGSS